MRKADITKMCRFWEGVLESVQSLDMEELAHDPVAFHSVKNSLIGILNNVLEQLHDAGVIGSKVQS